MVSHAKRGMQAWIDTTERVHRSYQAAGVQNINLSTVARKVYDRHALHQQIRRLRHMPQHAHAGPAHGEVNANPVVLPSVAEANAAKLAVRQAHNPNNAVPSPLTFNEYQGKLGSFATFAANTAERQRNVANSRRQTREGMSARFSLTTDVFLQPHANDNPQETYQNLAALTTHWVADPITPASGGKFMKRNELDPKRPDHAVLYGTKMSEDEITTHGQFYSNQMQLANMRPSNYTPLGMESIAPGVAYGELVRTQQTPDGNVHTAPGYQPGQNPSSSFGSNRKPIIVDAIMHYRQLGVVANNAADRRRALNASLSRSLNRFGYNVLNPARISKATLRRQQQNTLNALPPPPPPAALPPVGVLPPPAHNLPLPPPPLINHQLPPLPDVPGLQHPAPQHANNPLPPPPGNLPPPPHVD